MHEHWNVLRHMPRSSLSTSLELETKFVARLAEAILRTEGTGDDPLTFIQCNECDRWVCPECVSICPDPVCRITNCKGCKREAWRKCEWHSDDSMEQMRDARDQASYEANLRSKE